MEAAGEATALPRWPARGRVLVADENEEMRRTLAAFLGLLRILLVVTGHALGDGHEWSNYVHSRFAPHITPEAERWAALATLIETLRSFRLGLTRRRRNG